MYHSITFGDGTLYPEGDPREGQFAGVNTWDDWHLIPAERPSVATTQVSTNFVSVPGRDGSFDMTEFLMNRPTYSDRSGSWEFYVDNDHEYWETIRRKIMSFLHGNRMKAVLEDDPDWYWEGRFSVGNWDSEASHSKITINYVMSPYKRRIREEGNQDIVWDNFSFETDSDYYTEFNEIILEGTTYTGTLPGSDYPTPVSANVTVEPGNQVAITLNGVTKTATSSGTYQLGRTVEGDNAIQISETGTVGLVFRSGSL